MSCYVGPLMPVVQSAKWRWPTSAYLIADTEDELHKMASSIGLKRSWCHRNHYDLTYNKRIKALAHGCVRLETLRAVGLRLKEIKEKKNV